MEIFKPVRGYSGLYEVSNKGRVRSLDRLSVDGRRLRGKMMCPNIHPVKGYVRAHLYRGGSSRLIEIHRLVAEAFLGSVPKDCVVCHDNGIPNDNRVENLRIDTHQNNMLDVARHGRRPLKPEQIREIRSRGPYSKPRILAGEYGCSPRTIKRILQRQLYAGC